jgi:hypothetical protein
MSKSHDRPLWKASQKLREIFAEDVKYKKRALRVRLASPGLAELAEYLTSYAFTPRARPQDVGRVTSSERSMSAALVSLPLGGFRLGRLSV